jgi:hypothetical protein
MPFTFLSLWLLLQAQTVQLGPAGQAGDSQTIMGSRDGGAVFAVVCLSAMRLPTLSLPRAARAGVLGNLYMTPLIRQK